MSDIVRLLNMFVEVERWDSRVEFVELSEETFNSLLSDPKNVKIGIERHALREEPRLMGFGLNARFIRSKPDSHEGPITVWYHMQGVYGSTTRCLPDCADPDCVIRNVHAL